MKKILQKIYKNSPNLIQNIIISLFNIFAYSNRYSKEYKKFLNIYKKNNQLSKNEILLIQKQKYKHFVLEAVNSSNYYKNVFKNIKNPENIDNIKLLPILNKDILRKNIKSIHTIPKNKGFISKTGGTTGKSLEVIFNKKDIQERFAFLDNFRNEFGYELGKKTAWFSGKSLLNTKDIKKKRFWKTDYYYKVRYYSTFHINNKYLKHYIVNLKTFKPEYIVGFPSSMYEIAKYGLKNQINFPKNTIKAIFPTAETVTDEIRRTLETFFKTKLYNQYASSEGAPFIFECINNNLHLEQQSGVFEVLDKDNKSSKKGRLVVTSFSTTGTPLIRYDIGDEIKLSHKECNCNNNNPLVESILGRTSDYIFSEETGKINLGNLSNCLKGVRGVIKFQIQQHKIKKLLILMETDKLIFTKKDETIFLANLKERVGLKIKIEVNYVNNIGVESSGKFRIVKNYLSYK